MTTTRTTTTMTSRVTREVPLVTLKTAVSYLQRVVPAGQADQDLLVATIQSMMNAIKATPKKAN